MCWIIYLEGGTYFSGYSLIGEVKMTPDKNSAYRMLYPMAEQTLQKLSSLGYAGKIEQVEI